MKFLNVRKYYLAISPDSLKRQSSITKEINENLSLENVNTFLIPSKKIKMYYVNKLKIEI